MCFYHNRKKKKIQKKTFITDGKLAFSNGK